MKSVLAVATLAIVALVMEDRARALAGDAQHAYGELAVRTRDSTAAVTHGIESKPVAAVLMAGGLGYALAWLLPRRG